MSQDRYTLTYRTGEARQVMDWLKAGQSGCVVGLRGAGKSNFLRFLLRQDVRQHYLGPNDADFILVLVDLLALAEPAEWAVYELILDRLLSQLHSSGIAEETVAEMASHRREMTRSRDPFTARRAIERSLAVLCQQPTQRIVLLFDEFDTVFRTLPPSLFRLLRTIRDSHKGQVSYIVVVTDELAYLRDDLTEVEHFYRLVSRNVCGLGPYSEADARQMLRYLVSRRSSTLYQEDRMRLIELSGGHAGLLKTILNLLLNLLQEVGNPAEVTRVVTKMTPVLKDEPMIQAECRKIWASITESEQVGLKAVAAGILAPSDVLRRLKLKGLVREGKSSHQLFSPLFADFVRQQAPPQSKDSIIFRPQNQVQLEGQRPVTLSGLEFELFRFLYEHRERVCTKDELIQMIYRQQYNRDKVKSYEMMLQQLISRLRAKIEPDRKRPRYIVTVRGEGYKFVEPGEL